MRSKRLATFVLLAFLVLAGSPMAASAQQGTGWSTRVDLHEGTEAERGGDSTLICDPYQNLHIIWGGEINDRGYIFYQNDVGGKLNAPVDIIATDDAMVSQPAAVIDPVKNILHLVWSSAYTGGKLYYANAPLSLAGDPKAWSKPTLLHPRTSTLGGTMVRDSRGGLHVIYGVSEGDALQPRLEYIHSEDGGQRWSAPETIFFTNVPEASEIYGKLALDGVGRMHLGVTIRSFTYGVRSEVGYMRSDDGGKTWSKYQRIGDVSPGPQGMARMGAYAFGNDEIHLTWHDQERRMDQYSTDGGLTWHSPIEFASLGAAFGGHNQMTQDSAGTLYAITGTNGGFYTVPFRNRGWQPMETIDGATPFDPHDWQGIICGGNQFHATYNRAGEDKNLMYFTRQLAVPGIARQPIPAVVATAAPPGAAAAASPTEAAKAPQGDESSAQQTAPTRTSTPSPTAPLQSTTAVLLMATLPVLLLLAGVFVIKRR